MKLDGPPDVFACAREEGATTHMIMEHAGEELGSLYQRVDQINIASLIVQLLTGLQRLHHQHLVHNDITPPNILVDDRGLEKLVDFGQSFVYRS